MEMGNRKWRWAIGQCSPDSSGTDGRSPLPIRDLHRPLPISIADCPISIADGSMCLPLPIADGSIDHMKESII
jgi:hypothetical protein